MIQKQFSGNLHWAGWISGESGWTGGEYPWGLQLGVVERTPEITGGRMG